MNENLSLVADASEWKESDWDELDFIDQLEKQWREDLELLLPGIEAEWFSIFQQSPDDVIPAKIEEWERVAANARVSIREILGVIKQKSPPENQSFWREVLKYAFPSVRELAIANWQIQRLKMLLPHKNDHRRKWEDLVDIARAKELVAVAEQYGLRLRKTGATFSALCPFHTEQTPSFHIYPPSRFVCFGCDLKGDVIAFVQQLEGCGFKEAVHKLQGL